VAAEGPSAGGRRGKERAARNERSSDWRRGAAGSPDPDALRQNGLHEPDAWCSPDPEALECGRASVVWRGEFPSILLLRSRALFLMAPAWRRVTNTARSACPM
jgi:hypothetical protein